MCRDQSAKWLGARLGDFGVEVVEEGGNALVAYGLPLNNVRKPSLNKRAGLLPGGKYEELSMLLDAGLPIPLFSSQHTVVAQFPGVWLGRSNGHTGGTDIKVYRTRREAVVDPSDFYVQFVPNEQEFRCWVFRNKVLARYEKTNGGRHYDIYQGRNEANGFRWEFRQEQFSRTADRLAVEALAARRLDFGAVDMVRTESAGRFIVLEVNSAPGANGAHAVGLTKLAREIADWEQEDYPSA
jgi:hypothetical protein